MLYTLHRLPGFRGARGLAAAAVAVAIALVGSLGAASYASGQGEEESVGLMVTRSADRTSATATWSLPAGTGYQWVSVVAKTSADAPNTAAGLDQSTLRYAGGRLTGNIARLEIADLDPDKEYVFGHIRQRWNRETRQWELTEREIVWMPEQESEAEAKPEPQPQPQMPPASMTMLAEGVYHYFGFRTSVLVVVGDDEVLVTDTSNPLLAQSLKAEVANITDAPVTTIVLTHEHYDHVGGTGVFPEASVVCHRNCQAVFDLFDVSAVGDVPEVDQTFDDRLDIMVGDTLVELHYLGPGDGEATTIIYLPVEQIVVTADLYEPRELTHKNWVHDKNFTGVRAILNEVSTWPMTHAINAHSTGTDPMDLMENVAYYNDLYAAVRKAVEDAIAQAGVFFAAYGLYETLPQSLELAQYQGWGNYDSSFPAHVERMLLAIYHGD